MSAVCAQCVDRVEIHDLVLAAFADWLSDEVSWLRQCADWLAHLDADSRPPVVNLRPSADWPDRAVIAVDLARVRAVIDRIAADVDEGAAMQHYQDYQRMLRRELNLAPTTAMDELMHPLIASHTPQ